MHRWWVQRVMGSACRGLLVHLLVLLLLMVHLLVLVLLHAMASV